MNGDGLNLYEKKILTIGECAKACKVAPRTVSRWFDSGRLKGYRVPGSQDRRVPRDYLIEFLKEHGMPTDDFDLADKANTIHDDGTVETITRWQPGGAQGATMDMRGDLVVAVLTSDGWWDICSVNIDEDGTVSTPSGSKWQWAWREVEWYCPASEIDLPFREPQP